MMMMMMMIIIIINIIIIVISALYFVYQKRWFLLTINTVYCIHLKMSMSMSRNPKYIIYF